MSDDEFRDFGVSELNALLIDVVCVSTGVFDELDVGVVVCDDGLFSCCFFEQFEDMVEEFWVSCVRFGDSHGHSEGFSEGVPVGSHVAFSDGVNGCFEQESEVVWCSSLDEPLVEFRLFVVYSCCPVV